MSIRFNRPLLVATLVLMQTAHAAPDEEWKGTTLSDATLQKVQKALVGYQQCVNDVTQTHANDRVDSRAITDVVLKQCEEKLGAVKTAFDQEKVPAEISERYMRSRRTHAARSILKTVMGIQAMRSVAETPKP